MPRPPVPPRLALLPVAVRSAELLRGAVVPCGPGLRLSAWPETPSVRAAALHPRLREKRAAAQLTAAWIWGAARSPGTPLHLIALTGRPSYEPCDDGVRLHRFDIRDDELVDLGGLLTTTRLRTLFDLLRGDEFGSEQRIACRVLLASSPGLGDALRQELDARGPSRPYHQRIRARLEGRDAA